MTEQSRTLRLAEVARIVGVHPRTVRRWIDNEALPSVKICGTRLVPREALERLLASPEDTLTDEND